jgi:hypothetical protein
VQERRDRELQEHEDQQGHVQDQQEADDTANDTVFHTMSIHSINLDGSTRTPPPPPPPRGNSMDGSCHWRSTANDLIHSPATSSRSSTSASTVVDLLASPKASGDEDPFWDSGGNNQALLFNYCIFQKK